MLKPFLSEFVLEEKNPIHKNRNNIFYNENKREQDQVKIRERERVRETET
jgi:stress response protein SCP2